MFPKRDPWLEHVAKLLATSPKAMNIAVLKAMRAEEFTHHNASNSTLQQMVCQLAKSAYWSTSTNSNKLRFNNHVGSFKHQEIFLFW